MDRPLWVPDAQRLADSRMEAFRQFVNRRHARRLDDYFALHRWSIDERADFWQAIVDFFQLQFSQPARCVLEEGPQMPDARWFCGARLNYAEQLLRQPGAELALICIDEDGQRQQLSRAELAAEVAGLQRSLRSLGLQPGDRVAALLPNGRHAVVGLLACAGLGLVWSSCSPDFGSRGVLDRFSQIQPRLLIAVDSYRYAGQIFDLHDKLRELCAGLPELERLVLVDGPSGQPTPGDCPRALSRWDDFCQPGGEPHYLQLPFDHPLYILYSSGTTGVPKCIVQGAGSTLLQHLKELGLHCDLRGGDRLLYYSTCGWMMWNWQLSALALGCTLVLYDGSPFQPDPLRLLQLIDSEALTLFGVSAKYLSALEKAGVQGNRSLHLGSLRTLLSTGSPLAHESFDYVYRSLKADLCLASISGGTDIVSCFALGNPTLPVWPGELQCAGLGMAVEVHGEQGPLPAGQAGELVCTRHFPSMPLGFWNDDGSAYRAAYFERFPGIWAQGDYAERTAHGGLIIHGRSDAVLNPGGVRIGTAEIYRQVERLPEVLEALAVGQDWQGDVRIVLFVRLRDGLALDDALQAHIRQSIRSGASPRHVPALIIAVADLPRTRSGKLAELAVRQLIHRRPLNNREALANPEALELFIDLPQLQR